MDYSIFSDLLAKFHSASAPIQALWLVLATIVALSAIASITLILHLWLKQRARPLPPPNPEPELRKMGEIIYGVIRAPDGRWMLYLDGLVKEVGEEDRAWIVEARKREAEDQEGGGGAVH